MFCVSVSVVCAYCVPCPLFLGSSPYACTTHGQYKGRTIMIKPGSAFMLAGELPAEFSVIALQNNTRPNEYAA
ncbi:hypothetical protein M378DRAFT_167752 [Amanita muscaria Koide BX008]|uniref:Uncharacterized protein n=1 Tax=Amanita muscaria (strain Koide BX008) TaxID=946122 RepID=A0A0C2T2R3_AMAMK|nr:hypothetical protein M378DRAFT_167752 [Amanita muscaria Koide BX008]